MPQSAAIIGTGLVSPLGLDTATTFHHMLEGQVGLRPITRFSTEGLNQHVGGQLSDDDEATLLDTYAEDDLTWGLILQAAKEALGSLPPPGTAPDPTLGLILATNFGIMETLSWCWRERHDTNELDEETFRAQQDVVRTVAAYVGAGGPTSQLSLSCASGAAALHVGLEWIRTGRAQRVLAIGYDVLSEFTWTGLANLRTITDQQIKPFDHHRTGTIFSEGAAAILLSGKPEDQAKATTHLLGAATNNNAFHLTAPPSGAAGSHAVMQAAIADARIGPEAIAMVSAHATATRANDSTETVAITNLVDHSPPVAAFKSSLGHLLGAAGLAEAIISSCSITHGTIPPIANLTDQDPACKLDTVRDTPRTGTFPAAITNSAGIGGNNASTLIASIPAPDLPPKHAPRHHRTANTAWILPGHIGSGADLPQTTTAQLLADQATLDDFSVKPYLDSVKGYLDPIGKYTLGAAAICLQSAELADADHSRIAVVAATQYGAPSSGYAFHQQMITKGNRFASPLVFPHSYANTAPNLVAIEYGFAGPHMVFNTAPDISEAWWWATHLIRQNLADHVLLIAAEATQPHLIPDNFTVVNGAIAYHLTVADDQAAEPPAPSPAPANYHGTLFPLFQA